MINSAIVIHVLGVLLQMLGVFMLAAVPFSVYFGSLDLRALLLGSLTSLAAGFGLWYSTRKTNKNIGKREGFLIVALGWVVISIFSALPYLYYGLLPDITDAIFESVSGLTTTGATVIQDIEASPKGLLFWRSLTQWIGGMGIIVLTVALFPLLGIGGVELFVAEAPGPSSDKLHPRIKDTAKRLWFIYVGLTALLMIILYACGMNFYDAINHGLTTMATGGFSTKNASIAYFSNPAIHYWIALFMFIAGINYTIIYFTLKRNFKRVWSSDEMKVYVLGTTIIISAVAISIWAVADKSFPDAFREASFQVVSMITTTGFVLADYTSWQPALTFLFFILLFVGACAGSTSGGIKVIRHLVLFKNAFFETKRLLHPKAIIRTKVDKQVVAPRILTHILVFLLFYLMLFVFGSLILTYIMGDMDNPILTAAGAAATCLGNVGPAIGELGPMDNFTAVPVAGKWILVALMLLGRLELFTILILFTPYFWRIN